MDTKKLRQKILDLAIRGKLVPQDPTDEPASVLLQRIRAEKERLIAEGKIKRPKKSKTPSSESNYQNFTPPFEAPAYWGWCKIDDVAFVTKLAGFEYSKYIADNLSSEFGIPLFKGKNVKNGAIDYTFESFIPEPISDELWRSQITKKCLLTPYVGAIGNVGIHHKTGKFHLGSNVGKIEIFNEHESIYSEEYLRYYLLSTYGYKELTKHKKATAQESISIDAIRDVIIPVVGIDEQFRIVSEIEKWGKFLDNIDNGILQLTDYISLAKSKILELAMQGKLVPQDPTDEPAAEMLKRINPNAKILTDFQHSWNIPSNWIWISVKDIFKPMERELPSGDEFKYIDIDSIDNKTNTAHPKTILTKAAPSRASRKTRKGDIVFSMVRPYLKNIAIVPEDDCIASTGFYVLSCTRSINHVFAFLIAISDFFVKGLNSFMKGDNSPSINKDHIENYVIPLPPLNEQKRIVAKIEELYSVLDKIEASLQS